MRRKWTLRLVTTFISLLLAGLAANWMGLSSSPIGHAWATLDVERNRVPSLGPAPRGADGRFMNWSGVSDHGSFGVRLAFFGRRIGGMFRDRPGKPERVENDGAFVRAYPRHGEPSVTWVGHATLLVQMDQVTFLTDPIWTDTPSPVKFASPRRFVEPGITLENLPSIDFVLISHNHYDHLDRPTLRALAERNPETRFLVPIGHADLLRGDGIDRVEEFDWGDTVLHSGVTITCLPALHWSKRGLRDDRKALWSSWAVRGAQRNFYFSGDTGYFDGFSVIGEALGPFDLAAVAIGAYEPVAMMKESHMNPEEAVRATLDLKAKYAVGIHFGTFDLTDEPLDEPPRRFLEAAGSGELGRERAWVLRIGETRKF